MQRPLSAYEGWSQRDLCRLQIGIYAVVPGWKSEISGNYLLWLMPPAY